MTRILSNDLNIGDKAILVTWNRQLMYEDKKKLIENETHLTILEVFNARCVVTDGKRLYNVSNRELKPVNK